MCLAVTGRIVSKEGLSGVVDMNGMEVRTSFQLVPDARPGDYVLLHAGFAIQVVDEQEALETNALLSQVLEEEGP
ncbi:MAG: HypC/HybG/HupF family hydrogenase formation chaperone [Spirochaetota bacterium]